MKLRKKYVVVGLLIVVIMCIAIGIVVCTKKKENVKKDNRKISVNNKFIYENSDEKNIDKLIDIIITKKIKSSKKGYNLSISDDIESMVDNEFSKVMEEIENIYKTADKGDASNVTLSDDVIQKMIDKIKEKKYAVTSTEPYYNMENYKEIDEFLKSCTNKKKDITTLYRIQTDGSITREQYIYDSENMYVLTAIGSWNEEYNYVVSYMSLDKVDEWKYTDNGWFCYKVCVPEPPEVTETVDGSCLIRVKPLDDKYIEYTKKYVLPISYQGNNLLRSNWNKNKMNEIDYTGLFEYFYKMKYKKKYNPDKYGEGIPKKLFESTIKEYLNVSSKTLEKYGHFDKKSKKYRWMKLGYMNYVPKFFGTSFPEVIEIKENEDGIITLKVNAVCEMMLCSDEAITHELKIQTEKDDRFKYVENKVINVCEEGIPEYQYRISN